MKRILISILFAALPCAAASNALVDGRIAVVHEHHTSHKVWYASIGILAGGQFADAFSSIGGRELNGAIGNGSNGTFNVGRGFLIKSVLVGGLTGAEVLTNRSGNHDKFWIVVNSAFGGLGFAAAFHNWTVSK